MKRQMRTGIAWVTSVKKLVNQSASENKPKFNLKPMEFFENRSRPRISIVIRSNPAKCVLNTLQFSHVETGQTSEKRVAVVKTTAHQSIYHQDSSLICQVLSDPPEIMHLHEAGLSNIADLITEKLASNQIPTFLTTADGSESLPNIQTGR